MLALRPCIPMKAAVMIVRLTRRQLALRHTLCKWIIRVIGELVQQMLRCCEGIEGIGSPRLVVVVVVVRPRRQRVHVRRSRRSGPINVAIFLIASQADALPSRGTRSSKALDLVQLLTRHGRHKRVACHTIDAVHCVIT